MKKGYLRVGLIKDRIKNKVLIHRLVAIVFIDNPLNLPQVNHKDEVKSSNCSDNLEWCTNVYNKNYGTGIERYKQRMKEVLTNKRSARLEGEG